MWSSSLRTRRSSTTARLHEAPVEFALEPLLVEVLQTLLGLPSHPGCGIVVEQQAAV
jgi:hypothetical protein